MKFIPDFRSLPAQMILSFTAVVILTAIIAGIPSIWLVRRQLDYQAWSQIERGQYATQALYSAKQSEVADFAVLIAQRPTLQEMFAQGEQEKLVNYLESLLEGDELDLAAICDSNQKLIASTSEAAPDTICDTQSVGSQYMILKGIIPQVWLMAAYPLQSTSPVPGKVVVGLQLDDEFAALMRSQTGLEQTILVNGQVAATSYDTRAVFQATVFPQSAILNTPEVLICCTFDLGGQPYYAARLPLSGSGLEVEVALIVADINSAQRRLGWILAGAMLVVAVFGSAIGVFLARRISRPLVTLAETAAEFSRGDLSSPVSVETNLREVVQVSHALENARIDLLKNLTDLRKEKVWSSHLLESIVEGILTLDDELKITFFSHGAERITGWNRDQVLQRSCDEVFELVNSENSFSQHIPMPGMQSKVVVDLADRQATLSITGARLAPSEAGEAQVALVFRDVSEEELIHHILGHFIANVAHEFRTPLSALAASIELLLDQESDYTASEMQELLKSLHLGILSLQTLVDNLLESASMEAGHFRVSPRPYDLSAIVTEAVDTMRPLLDKYGQRLEVEMPADLPVVRADPRRTVQVLVNLLSNASKYGPPDAEITLGVTVNKNWVQVHVADRGPGIPEGYRENLFRRFDRPGISENPSKAGAGLGLSVVKAIVEAQGGKTELSDRPGGGSIFWFTLPIASEI
jgi:two-component system phosphate regulon sensor histidine kinase PhoR